MYAVYKELHPPTGVDHCLQCHFFDLLHDSLVVASTSLLRVYDIKQVVPTCPLALKCVVVYNYCTVASLVTSPVLVGIYWNS